VASSDDLIENRNTLIYKNAAKERIIWRKHQENIAINLLNQITRILIQATEFAHSRRNSTCSWNLVRANDCF